MVQHSESVLATIRDKERALEKEIRAAQERANARVVEARARADEIKAQAERDGMRDAEALYQDGLAHARLEAQTIQTHGEEQATALRQAGHARIQKAIEYIIQFVLPHSET
jgi:F-type H+-transporting ATPase subunit b